MSKKDDVTHLSRGFTFVWSKKKAGEVLRDHGIDFEEAASAYFDTNMIAKPDEDPLRGQYIGFSYYARLLLVVHAKVEDDDTLRLITAWVADRKARKDYTDARRKPGAKKKTRRDPPSQRRGSVFLRFIGRHRVANGENNREPWPVRSHAPGKHRQRQEKAWALFRAEKIAHPGKRLQTIRRLRGWSQGELARRSRVTQAEISRIENGKSPLGLRRAKALARALGVKPMVLLWRTGSKS